MKNFLKTAGLFCFCTILAFAAPKEARADVKTSELQTSSSMFVQVEEMSTNLYAEPEDHAEVIGQADRNTTYAILELVDGKWAKISNGDVEGYLNTVEAAATVAEEAAEVEVEVVDPSTAKRNHVVEYAKQFIGGRYVYGGTNPNTGADCSGFTSYVMRNAAGVSLPHHSGSQASHGRTISASEIRPGDLVFYSEGGRINHVGIYIGDGQIVHASNPKNGIRISNWTYRKPSQIVNVLGD